MDKKEFNLPQTPRAHADMCQPKNIGGWEKVGSEGTIDKETPKAIATGAKTEIGFFFIYPCRRKDSAET